MGPERALASACALLQHTGERRTNHDGCPRRRQTGAGPTGVLGGVRVVRAAAPCCSGDCAGQPAGGRCRDARDLRDVHRGERRSTVFVGRADCTERVHQRRLSHRRHGHGQSTTADPRLCEPRCGPGGRRCPTSDRSPTQPSGRGHDDVERPGLEWPRRHLRELSMGRQRRGRDRFRPGRRESLESGGANGHRTAGGWPRLRLGHARPGSGVWVPRGGSRRLRELFQPPRGRLGLYRPLMGHGPDSPSGRRAGPGQRGRRLLPPEQLGRRRRFPVAPWEHPGRVRGARRSGHQHHERPGQYDRQRVYRCQRPQRRLRSGLDADRRLTAALHRRAPDRGERRHSGRPVPQRLGQPFHRCPLSVGLRLDRVDRLQRRQPRGLERRGEHPAAGARADGSDQRQRTTGSCRSPARSTTRSRGVSPPAATRATPSA